MSLLDCYEKIWGCCDASISPSKFNAFSAETEEKINDLQEQIDNIEISGITYSAGTNIDITDHVISVTGIDTSNFASKEDLNELSGKVDTLSATVETITGDVITINNDITAISATIDSISAVTEQDLEEALATKQDVLSSGAFIDITNNVVSAKIVVLTKAQWEALTVKDNSVIYLIKE